MAKTDIKKSKTLAKSKVKSPLKKVKKDTKITKRAGASKKVVPKKNVKQVKAKQLKKTPAKKTKSSTTTKVKKPVVKKKTAVKSKPSTTKKPTTKAKAVKKSTTKPKPKTPSKTSKKAVKKETKRVTKKKVVATKVKKPKTPGTKKKLTKKDSKTKQKQTAVKKASKKVVSAKKAKTPAKKQKTSKKVNVPSPKKKLVTKKIKVTKQLKKVSKTKPKSKSLKPKPKQKSGSQKLQKPYKKSVTLKTVSKAAKAARDNKTKLSATKVKAVPSKAKLTADKLKAASLKKQGTKSPKQAKAKESKSVKKPYKKQAVKSKTMTASQKQQLKKVKAAKKLKATKSATKEAYKGKENKAPVKKRKALGKDSEKGVKKIKLTAKETAKKKPVKKTQKQTLKISIQKKSAKASTEKKGAKKLSVAVKKQKKTEKKSPLKQNLKQNFRLHKVSAPKATTPKKKKGKSIDEIGNWSPSVPEVSTASPVWGYTPPGNFGKKSMVVYQEQAAQENTKASDKNKKSAKSNPSKIRVLSGTSFNLKTTGDDKAVWITGMAMFPNGQLIMCDIQNVKLKLYDASTLKLLSFVKTLKLPQDISVSALNATDAYFTLNMEKAIQKCSIRENSIVLGEKFSVNGCCRGIVCTTNGIITSVDSSAFLGYQIQVRDYDGTIMRTISNMQGKLFSHPICFDITSDGDKLVISDCALMSATICLDINGKVVYRYTGVSRQRGITLDESNNVYLPDHSSTNKVILLSSEGREVKELVTNSTKGVKANLTKPYQIVHHRVKGVPMLFLSIQENDTMYAFKLSN